MVVEDLIVTAEDVCTGKIICGYVCGCKLCRESKLKTEVYDKSRPTGLMTDPDGEWGGVRVYLDTLKPLKPRI